MPGVLHKGKINIYIYIYICIYIYIYIYIWEFPKIGVPYFAVLIISKGILLFGVLYWDPLFSETSIYIYTHIYAYILD